MNEDLKALLEQFDVSEETVTQLSEMISAAVESGAEEKIQKLQEEHQAEIESLNEEHEAAIAELKEHANEYGQYIHDDLMEKVNSYAEYVTEKFVAEHKEQFLAAEKVLRIEECFNAVKEAFELNGFNLDENAVATGLEKDLQEAKESYQKVYDDLQEALQENQQLQRNAVFHKLTKDLADTDVERVAELAEAVEFDNLDQYTRGIELIVENVTSKEEEAEEVITEGLEDQPEGNQKPVLQEGMDKYISALRRLSQ